jgi:ABC-type transporter Mla MlaB component
MVTSTRISQAPTLLLQWVTNGLTKVAAQRLRRRPQADVAATMVDAPSLAIQVALLHGLTAAAHVQVVGELDRFTYEALIETAHDLYRRGRRNLLLDLRQLKRIELSGFFALLSIAHLYSGRPLPNPEAGWTALRNAAEEITPTMGQRVKLLATPAMTHLIRTNHFCDCFEIYADPESANAAFPA